ncbi:S-layer homology domain-containing protein [Peptoniphilus sp. GNH]|nr:S-layer homology domain-containing protein [Peptoniphilus sp. GNH]
MNKIKRIISATLVGIMIIPSAVSAFQTAPVENINPIIQTVELREAANKADIPSIKYEAMPLIDENDAMNAGIKGLWENGKFKYTKEEYNKMLAARYKDNNSLFNVEIGVNPYYEVEIKDNKANLTVSYVNNVMGEESPEEYGLVKIDDDEDIIYKTADGNSQPVEILDAEEFTLDPARDEYGERITKIRLDNVPLSKLGDANQFIYLENARYVRCYSEWEDLKVDAKPAKGEESTENMYGIFNFDLNKMVLVESAKPGLNKATLQEKVNEAKAIEQGKKTDEAFAKLKAAIAAAEETLKTATDQKALNQGVATLQAAVEAFKTSEDVKIPVEDGIYTAPVRVDHAYDLGKQSMANGAIEHTAKVVYRGDKVTLELTFNGMDLMKMKGHLTNLFFYKDNKDPKNNNDVIEAEVIKTQLDLGLDGKKHNYPQIFKYTMDKSVFEASDFLWIKVWVDAMDAIASIGEPTVIPGKGAQNAKIVIDKTNFTKVILNTQDLSNAIKAAKEIVKGNKKVEEFNILQSVITEAEKVLKEATDQDDLDKEVTTLKAAVEDFKASEDVKLPTEDGIYLASVEIGHASNPGQKSMANGAIEHIAKLILKEDKVKVELTFKGMDLSGMKGHLTNLFYFENNQDPRSGGRAVETKIEKNFTDMGLDGQEKEFPQVFSFTMDRNLFEASEFLWCRVWVDAMDFIMGGPGKGAQEARIIINKEHLQKVVLNTEALTKEIAAAKEIVKGKKTEEAFKKLKAAITAAEETLKTATDQEALNQGVATLKAAVETFNNSPNVLEKEALTKEIAEAKKIEQGKKTDEAFKKLKAAIAAAEETLKTATDQEALNQGVATLKAAVETFNNSPNVLEKEALTKEIAEAKKIEQGKKTDEAFKKLKAAITAAEETLKTATDQEALNQGVATLKAAVETFNNSPNVLEKEALTKEIAEAKKIEQGKKTEEAFNTLKAAIAAAEETLKTATDQEALNQGVSTLKAAVETFKNSPNVLEKEALTKEIAAAKEIVKGKKTEEAFKKLKKAITAAEETLKTATDQEALNQAVATLKAAVETFKNSPNVLEKEALTKEIAEAKKIEQGKKTDEAFSKLKKAIAAAEKVLGEATEQTQLDEAVKALKTAVKAFKESADKVEPQAPLKKEALTKEIAEAKKIEQGKKTDEAFKKLKAAIAAAEKVLGEATEQTQLDEAATTLKAAVETFNNSPDKKVTPTPTPTPTPQPDPKPTPNYPSYPSYPRDNSTTAGSTTKPTADKGTKNAETKSPAKEVKREAQNSKADNFTDIEGHWAKEAIKYVVNKGYFQGVNDREFAPNKGITRGQLVTVLGRILNIDKTAFKSNNFKDVKADAYYAPYIAWAESVGITKGRGNGSFDPDKEITREEMAVMMVKFLKLSGKKINVKGTASAFKDDTNIESWAKDAVVEMAKLGLVKGMEDGSFSPKTQFTRAQVAQILYNIDKN